MRGLEDTALSFDRACRRAGVPYALIGGFAVSAWGQPRTTAVVDALVHLEDASFVASFVDALRADGLSADARDFEDALRGAGHVTVFDEVTVFHVDVKVARTAAEVEQVASARVVSFHGGELSFARPEDTLAYKLSFGTDQDVKDARSILALQAGRLDEARLAAIARRLGVTEALRRAQDAVAREP